MNCIRCLLAPLAGFVLLCACKTKAPQQQQSEEDYIMGEQYTVKVIDTAGILITRIDGVGEGKIVFRVTDKKDFDGGWFRNTKTWEKDETALSLAVVLNDSARATMKSSSLTTESYNTWLTRQVFNKGYKRERTWEGFEYFDLIINRYYASSGHMYGPAGKKTCSGFPDPENYSQEQV